MALRAETVTDRHAERGSGRAVAAVDGEVVHRHVERAGLQRDDVAHERDRRVGDLSARRVDLHHRARACDGQKKRFKTCANTGTNEGTSA